LGKDTHIPVLDHLRGIAAASVCFFHFGGQEGLLPPENAVARLASFGWLGVEAFFVISGFVIPYSLHARTYRLRDGGDFFLRRLKRLEPPYFVCIVLVIVLHWLSSMAPGFRGEPIDLSWQRLAAHIGYLIAILDFKWLNPVFWTLAIEFQYYIFMAIVFPLLAHKRAPVRVASVVGIALLGFVGAGNRALLPHWLPLFALGMASYQFYVGNLPTGMYAVLFGLVSLISFMIVGTQETVVGMLTALTIIGCATRQLPRFLAPLAFLGTMSYSLYLVHVPIGGRVMSLAMRLSESLLIRYTAIAVAFGLSILAGYIFWLCIERPSQRWAKTPGLLPRRRPQTAPPTQPV